MNYGFMNLGAVNLGLIDLGPHAVFIWVSYALFYGVLLGLILWVFWSGSHLKSRIADLEARGVARRSKTRSL